MARAPTRRPTDLDHLADEGFDPPTDLLTLPWFDAHNHVHTLSWADRERFALAGCRGMVAVASGYHWTPYRPVAPGDVRALWDGALSRLRAVERSHFFETRLAVGVHTGVRVTEPEALLASMAEYCRLDAVAAVGETGVTPGGGPAGWDLEGQRAAIEAQMELAADHDLPVLLHTPNRGSTAAPGRRAAVGRRGYERLPTAGGDPAPALDGENPALEAVRLDVRAARAAGLPEERVVASHADPNNAPYLMAETDCYLSYTLGYPWLTGVTAETVADAIAEYGPDRILVETDCANVLRTDPLSVKRAVLDLYALGVDPAAIRRVVHDNPREVFGFDG